MINPVYFEEDSINKIKEIFDRDGSIQLQNFFDREYLNKLINKIKNVKLKIEYDPMLHSYNYSEFEDKELINELNKILSKINIKLSLSLSSSRLFCFGHRDYSLLSDKINEEEGIKIIIELTKDWNHEANGYTSFVMDNKELVRINSIGNSVSIIKTDNNIKSFVKYINHYALNKKRYFIELKYEERN